MAEPFLAEIRIFAFNYPPRGWAFCNGQLLPINQNQALFSLLGTTYGGNGSTNFALPNLRGKVPMHEGSGHTLGETGGSESVTINIQQLPQHLHFLNALADDGDNNNPTGRQFAKAANNLYAGPTNLVAMAPEA